MDIRKRAQWFVGGLLCAALLPWQAWAEDAPTAPIAAEWRSHEYLFAYTGYTTLYSCDGLEWKLKLLLKAAGAREDVSVRATCGDPPGMPSRLVTARLRFSTLALPGSPPAPGEKADPTKPPVAAEAEWRTVKFAQRSPRELDGGDCELVDQFDRELLSFFTIRNRHQRMSCMPRQVSAFGIDLSFDALMPVPKKTAEPAQ